MIPEFGLFTLILALCASFTLALAPIWGAITPQLAALKKIVPSAVFAQCFFVTLSFLTLVSCFVQNDFSVRYVAENSNTQLPLIYKICAVWGAHEGSLLLWSFILTLWTLIVRLSTHDLPEQFKTIVFAILGSINVGFLLLLLHTSNPFSRILPFSPENGADLNPLLQDPGFVLHPPFLYLGYVGFALPFAFALTGLLLKDVKNIWAIWARPWALLAWGFLTIGIILGSWWAYYELGWGGWWFWDPVENASFMPWLVGAALTHALYLCVKRGAFASWTLLLAICAFALSLLGTFLVRSGVLSSVHAFASSPTRGVFILSFLILVIAGSLMLYLTRIKNWQATAQNVLLSRASFVLLGNMILTVGMLTVLLGTLYPLAMEVLTEEKISVGPPYFNAVFVPMMFPILILMGLIPNISWGEIKWLPFFQKHALLLPLLVVALMIAGYWIYQDYPLFSILGIVLSFWVLYSTILKLISHCRRKNHGIEFTLPWHKWGMPLAHMGIAISVLGIALLTVLETEKEIKMSVGEVTQVAGYDFHFQAIHLTKGSNFEGKKAKFVIKSQNKWIAEVYPEKRFFNPRQLAISETAIHPTLLRDFYVALGEQLGNESWSVRLYVKPFIRWIWLGGLLVALGAGISGIAAFRDINKNRS